MEKADQRRYYTGEQIQVSPLESSHDIYLSD